MAPFFFSFQPGAGEVDEGILDLLPRLVATAAWIGGEVQPAVDALAEAQALRASGDSNREVAPSSEEVFGREWPAS